MLDPLLSLKSPFFNEARTTWAYLIARGLRRLRADAKPLLMRDRVAWVDINEQPDCRRNCRENLFVDVHTNCRGDEVVATLIRKHLRDLNYVGKTTTSG